VKLRRSVINTAAFFRNISAKKMAALLMAVSILISCNNSSKKYPSASQLNDGLYDSVFPNRPTSEYLRNIAASVKLISVFSVYNVYSYEENTPKSLILNNPEKYAYQIYVEEKPANGTGTVIYNRGGVVGLLTCAHVVSTPDTVIRYFDDDSLMIKSIQILKRQTRIVVGLDDFQDFEIFKLDRKNDLALIGKKIPLKNAEKISIFPFKPGRSSDIDWGTFTYIFGYPKGKIMVSTAIVSSPPTRKNDKFILDASLPRGISGGMVLALRNGPPNFELIGMINAVSADLAKVLVPDRRMNSQNDHPGRPYTGDIYAKIVPRVSYGIEYAIGIDKIMKFLSNNRKTLALYGFKNEYFFKTSHDMKKD
jgi:hypothetical protein